MSPDDYRGAKRIVDAEIGRLYRRWGAAVAAEVGREDLVQIGLLAWIRCDGPAAQKRMAIRHDFSDLLRASSGIRRKYKDALTDHARDWRATQGYQPLSPIEGYEPLSEVEAIVDLERRLTHLERTAPRAMQCVEGFAWGEDSAEIAKRLRVLRKTVQVHFYCFRRALARM